MDIASQIFNLSILSLAVASVSWTVTQEEIFAELRDFCSEKSTTASSLIVRKFFYLFTCEYCFSHWVTLFFIILTDFHLIFQDWRGLVIAYFVLPWIANQWMSLYRRLRVVIKRENVLAEIEKEKNQ